MYHYTYLYIHMYVLINCDLICCCPHACRYILKIYIKVIKYNYVYIHYNSKVTMQDFTKKSISNQGYYHE